MRLSLAAVAVAFLVVSVRAEPAHVTVIAKDGRHSGTLDVTSVDVDAKPRPVKLSWADVAFIRFGDGDVVRTRQGKTVKGAVRIDGWTLREGEADRPLSRDDLRFIVPQVPLGAPRKGQTVHAASASGMTYHVRLPEKYDPAAGKPAIVLLHGSNANSADYVLGVTQRWPKVAADYVLIGIDGEWPVQKDADAPPAFNYTYVNFVGKSKYKGFPGSDRESPALVAETVAEIRKQLKLTKVFVTGHSQGGFLAYCCLMNYPEVFDGAMAISAGLIFQCEPTAYEDESIRREQRRRPLAIVHGDSDPLVNISMGRSAYESFLDDRFPMVRLLVAKGAGHAFIALPIEDGIRWLESMTSGDPKALAAFAQQAFARRDYRDAVTYLNREREVDPAGKESTSAAALRKKIEQLAAAPAKELEAAIRDNKDGGWVRAFDPFRRDFEFTDAAAGVMAEYAKLRKAHQPAAEKLWAEVRQAFQKGDKQRGYRKCEEIIGKYYASTTYRYARQTLDERDK